jgi:glutaredoxin-like protein
MLPSAASLEGKPIPEVTFKTRAGGQPRDIGSDALFKGKTVVVFALPGAYTPTCSTAHLPRFNELAPLMRRNGVDDIICISVNDAFVMEEWRRGQEAENITMIPDGNGEFTEGMGLLVDKRAIGLGQRSWRYSMLVRDGIIDKAFLEAYDDTDPDGDPFEVSDADTMLHYLAPDAVAPEPVVMFSKPGCPFCARAKAVLKARGIAFTDISQDSKINTSVLRAVSGGTTWPQVFEGGHLIGGADEVVAYFGPAPSAEAAADAPRA